MTGAICKAKYVGLNVLRYCMQALGSGLKPVCRPGGRLPLFSTRFADTIRIAEHHRPVDSARWKKT